MVVSYIYDYFVKHALVKEFTTHLIQKTKTISQVCKLNNDIGFTIFSIQKGRGAPIISHFNSF